MIQQTSLSAYEDLQPKLGLLQRKVLAVIKEVGPINNKLISHYTGLDINVVTPRVNELVKKRMVEQNHVAPCPITGKNVIYWRARR